MPRRAAPATAAASSPTRSTGSATTSAPPARILVTGGHGFVGRAVVERLRRQRWSETDGDKTNGALSMGQLDSKYIVASLDTAADGDSSAYAASVLDPAALDAAFADFGPDVVVHAAGIVPTGLARYSRAQYASVRAVNVDGTANVLAAARRHGVARLVYTSTCCVLTDDYAHEYPNYSEDTPYPSSSTIYGETKAEAERLVLAANTLDLVTCAIRPSVIFGEGDYQLIPTIHACIAKGETPFCIGPGDNLYDFTYIDNIAHAHVLAVDNLLTTRSAAGRAISISNGQPVAFRDFCLAVWAEWAHAPACTVVIPARLAWVAGALAELAAYVWAGPATTLCRGSVNDALGTRYADLATARALLGYQPVVDLWDGLARTCAAHKARLKGGSGGKRLQNGSGMNLSNGKAKN